MGFLDLLEKKQDKVTVSEMALVKKHLPERVKVAVPACMYRVPGDDGIPSVDYEVYGVLAWVIAHREDNDITIAEVGDRIGARENEQLQKITREILYFYTTFTRQEVEERFFTEDVLEEGEEGDTGNPPLEPPSKSSTKSSKT